MVVAPASILRELAPDAARCVKRWALEMHMTEGEIVTRLVRNAALLVHARRAGTTLDAMRSALSEGLHIPHGQTADVVVSAINTRPGPWRVPQIRAYLRDTQDYFIDAKSLTSLLTVLRKNGRVVSGGWGVVQRVEPQQ
jgi:hypothetical protein